MTEERLKEIGHIMKEVEAQIDDYINDSGSPLFTQEEMYHMRNIFDGILQRKIIKGATNG